MSEKAGIKFNTKTWHYKLIKFVLKDAAPTPQNMHNLCPYFWLLIFSMFAAPFKLFFGALGAGLYWLGSKMANGILWAVDQVLIEPTAKGWFNGLTDLEVLELYNGNKSVSKAFYRAKFGKNASGYEMGRNEVIEKWFKQTYNEPVYNNESKNYKDYTEAFIKWKDEQFAIKRRLDKEREDRIAKRRAAVDISEFVDSVDKLFQKTKSSVQSWTNIIKWTKRTVGALITSAGLTLVYFIVNFIGRGFLWLVENFNGPVVLDNLISFGVVIGIIAVVVGIIFVLRLWVLYVAEQGLKLWYIKVIYYPLFWIIYTPFKFILYDFVFMFVLVNLLKGIVGGAKMTWFGFLGFLGIFGEYFGASYSDYCPGIEWEENQTNEK